MPIKIFQSYDYKRTATFLRFTAYKIYIYLFAKPTGTDTNIRVERACSVCLARLHWRPAAVPYGDGQRVAESTEECLLEFRKKTVVTPILKKQSLHPQDLKNYKPTGRCLTSALFQSWMKGSWSCSWWQQATYLLPELHSAYRRRHLIETRMWNVLSDVLIAADTEKVTMFASLHLSAAVDCVPWNFTTHAADCSSPLVLKKLIDWLNLAK